MLLRKRCRRKSEVDSRDGGDGNLDGTGSDGVVRVIRKSAQTDSNSMTAKERWVEA